MNTKNNLTNSAKRESYKSHRLSKPLEASSLPKKKTEMIDIPVLEMEDLERLYKEQK